ncbi:hypothetical protein APSETT444_000122 [Aspergillus pseudonomiae]
MEGTEALNNLNQSENSPLLNIDGSTPDFEYPDDYISQVSTWIETLGWSNRDTDSDLGEDTGQQIAIASYINPLGDLASWNDSSHIYYMMLGSFTTHSGHK